MPVTKLSVRLISLTPPLVMMPPPREAVLPSTRQLWARGHLAQASDAAGAGCAPPLRVSGHQVRVPLDIELPNVLSV